jgi:hypothetical protein
MNDDITVVSGLPRSGTSMMMRMLEAGGMEVVTDGIRGADSDNPEGYYEYERVKKIQADASWLPATRGKAFKMVSLLLLHLPSGHEYRIVFMRRNMSEILASQTRMLARLGKGDSKTDDQKMRAMFEKHLAQVEQWLASRPNVRVLFVDYNETVADPAAAAVRVAGFLSHPLDTQRMAAAVDPRLYRNRA